MISRIRGQLVDAGLDHAVVDCGGVGYHLQVSAQTSAALPALGNEISLHAHLISRDDSMNLYGFSDADERALFQSLLGVSSVGPKVALAVVGSAPAAILRSAIAGGDVARLQAVPGVGKRTAERICLDLREQLSASSILMDETVPDSPRALARDGLLGLGVEERLVDGLLDEAHGETVEALIQSALKARSR